MSLYRVVVNSRKGHLTVEQFTKEFPTYYLLNKQEVKNVLACNGNLARTYINCFPHDFYSEEEEGIK
jgi:hypothetical protein